MDEQFNLEEVYEQEIKPLVKQIVAICERVKMPMVAGFTVWADDKEHLNHILGSFHEGRYVAEFQALVDSVDD